MDATLGTSRLTINQPNVRAKVANAAWRTSDRCKFAVPTSRRRASTNVSSALRSGVRTDETIHPLTHIYDLKNSTAHALKVYGKPFNLWQTARTVARNFGIATNSTHAVLVEGEEHLWPHAYCRRYLLQHPSPSTKRFCFSAQATWPPGIPPPIVLVPETTKFCCPVSHLRGGFYWMLDCNRPEANWVRHFLRHRQGHSHARFHWYARFAKYAIC